LELNLIKGSKSWIKFLSEEDDCGLKEEEDTKIRSH
jgi:hypothetical protein